MLGVPFDNVTTAETIALVERMVASGRPHYLVTANVDFLVQALHDVELRRILFEADLVLCDGTPLLWASRWLGNPLTERVAGSDLVPLLARTAAEKGYRLFFLGGSPETTEQAVAKLKERHPALIVAGHYSPPFRTLLDMDHEEIKRRIVEACPDLLFVCFGCPKQEKWIAMHYRFLHAPVCIGVGGTIDFLAGRLARAPLWMQRIGIEWVFRLLQEPRRLFIRYLRDCWYFVGSIAAQWWRMRFRRSKRPPTLARGQSSRSEPCHVVACPEWLDAESVERDASLWEEALAETSHLLVDLQQVRFIDSTGVGLLIRLRRRAGSRDRQVVLIAPSPPVRRALHHMRLWPFFMTAADHESAKALLKDLPGARPVFEPNLLAPAPALVWRGEVTAALADEVWKATETFVVSHSGSGAELSIDLAGVAFIDSTAAGLMVRTKKLALKEGVKLKFLSLQPNVRNVLRLSNLEEYLLGNREKGPQAR